MYTERTVHKHLPSFLDGVPAHQRVQHGINGFTHVLNQDTVTIGQCSLNCIQVTANGTRNRSTTTVATAHEFVHTHVCARIAVWVQVHVWHCADVCVCMCHPLLTPLIPGE